MVMPPSEVLGVRNLTFEYVFLNRDETAKSTVPNSDQEAFHLNPDCKRGKVKKKTVLSFPSLASYLLRVYVLKTLAMPSLTSHLLHLDEKALKAATQHPFLTAAATSSLPLAQLKAWLGQDRLYALAYANFMGSLLAKIPIPSHTERESSLEWRLADAIIDCLNNIRTEIKMFEETAAAEGWLEDICGLNPTVETRAYQDLFAGATAQGRPLIVGLTVLWATEEAYLRSWRFAWSKMDQGLKAKEKDVMQRVFIPNWSSSEFEALVRKLGALVNKFGASLEEEGYEWTECEVAWKQVLWCERNFWPEVDEKKT